MNRTHVSVAVLLILAADILAACGAPTPSPTPLSPPAHAYAPQPEPNFALYFSYGSCLPETLDTFQGTFSRSMCPPDPPVTISLTLSAEEMQTIYRELAAIDLFGYPDQFSVTVPEGAIVGKVTPGDSYYLRMRNGEVDKELYWTDDITEPTTQEADRLRLFLKKIIDIIYQHPEIKQIPTPGCGCA